MSDLQSVDVLIVGGSFAGSAAAKRTVDAGLDTLVLERFELPRHKICSGIVSPRGHRFLIENYGPLPKEALHEPAACTGVMFHFPSLRSVPVQFDGGPTAHLNRKHSDHWALMRSGAGVHDKTRVLRIEDKGSHVEVLARRDQRDVHYRARMVIAADGPSSTVVRSLYPGYRASIPWFAVKQHFHEIIRCPLDEKYFHFWFHRELGQYTWSHKRGDRQIVGVGFEAGDNMEERHARVIRYLEDAHGVALGPSLEHEGSINNFGLSLINRYVFGKGNVAVTGQAAGFLNMIAEGMSVAMHSGAISGEAVTEALRSGRPLQQVYRQMIASEVRRCSDQWNPIEIVFGRPHEGDFWGAVACQGYSKLSITRELMRFIPVFGKYGWGRQMLAQSLYRKVRDGYDPSRWM